MIHIKRAYNPVSDGDGFRILVDRLWPRGVSKDRLKIDLWLKDVAPSNELRKWFAHDPKKWEEFQAKYRKELEEKSQYLDQIRELGEEEENIIIFLGFKTGAILRGAILCSYPPFLKYKNGFGQISNF